MSVKSIQVKLVIPRSQRGEAIRRAAGTTHLIHNAGVRYFMEQLLCLRQEDVYEDHESGKPTKRADEFQKELIEIARSAQKRNGILNKGTDEEILKLLREVYKQVVPASIGEKGDNQSIARDWLGSFVSKESESGLGKSTSGRKPTWMKLPDSDPRKKEAKLKYESRKTEAKSVELRPKLKDLGLLPLWPMFRLQSGWLWAGVEKGEKIRAWKDDQLTSWERDMFQQALERISSWESWNQKAKDRQKEAKDELDAWRSEHEIDFSKWNPIFDQYEKNRTTDLEQGSLGLKRLFRIGGRMLRGWDRIREKWLDAIKKDPRPHAVDLLNIARAWQEANPREVGDMHFIEYLAREENWSVWRDDTDFTLFQVKYNSLLIDFEKSKPWTTMTLPDSCKHPLWPRLDVPNGTNLNDYSIKSDGKGGWDLGLALLFPEGKNLIEKRETLPVAASGQMKYISATKDSPRDIILTDQGTGEKFNGKWGGASIRLNRDMLEKIKEKNLLLLKGRAVYVNLTLDLEGRKAIPIRGFKKTPRGAAGAQFLVGLEEPEEIAKINDLGCLSVDLGVRQMAACSVFRMKTQAAQGKFTIHIPGVKKVMEHERSFLLPLPGERPDPRVKALRNALWEKLRTLSNSLRGMNALIRLSNLESEQREKELDGLIQDEIGIYEQKDLMELKEAVSLDLKSWCYKIEKIHKTWEGQFSKALRVWRKGEIRLANGRSRQFGVWGLSLEGIDYLEKVRKLLIRWTNHPRKAKEINRLPENKKFAARLQTHIDALKEDRIKKSADAIVMAALGFSAGRGAENKRHDSCGIILFEDLARYRFRTDRPRHENGMLMRWAHRALFEETARQAGLFGIAVGKVGAGFTSRFHARSGSPGFRCLSVTKDVMDKAWFKKKIEDEELDMAQIKIGSVIPWDGGEIFCTLDESGKPILVHADINAAQNLQRRFWMNYEEQFRVVCAAGGRKDLLIPITGERNKIYFKGKLLESIKHGSPGICQIISGSKRGAGGKVYEDGNLDSMENLGYMHEEDEAVIGKRTIYFRDPSGLMLTESRWYESKVFWGQIKQKIRNALSV